MLTVVNPHFPDATPTRVGIVTRVNSISKTIQIKDELDQIINIDFFRIVGVKVIS